MTVPLGSPLPSIAILIVAAGASARMDGVDKVWADLAGEPVLMRSIRSLSAAGVKLIVVAKPGDETRVRSLISSSEISADLTVATGGRRRQDSVAAGLSLVRDEEYVAIHDCARPMVTASLLTRVRRAALPTGAAIPVFALTDTIKEAINGRIVKTLDRTSLVAAQTPQVFLTNLLRQAYKFADANNITATDDSALVALIGVDVRAVSGEPDNFKITTSLDLERARLQCRSSGRVSSREVPV